MLQYPPDFRSWRRWITQQIPILKIGGSNPSERANQKTSFVYRQKAFFGMMFTLMGKYDASIMMCGFRYIKTSIALL